MADVRIQRDELTVRINTALKGEEEARKDLDALCKKFEGMRPLKWAFCTSRVSLGYQLEAAIL